MIAIAPGAAYGSAKRWPPAAFAELVAGLAEDGVTAVMLGTSADRATTGAAAEVRVQARAFELRELAVEPQRDVLAGADAAAVVECASHACPRRSVLALVSHEFVGLTSAKLPDPPGATRGCNDYRQRRRSR